MAFDPYIPHRQNLLTSDEVRELSCLRPWRVLRDMSIQWIIILTAWTTVALWTHWWVVALLLPIIGTRHYALHILAHDGFHRRLFANFWWNDLFTDMFLVCPAFGVTHVNMGNHQLHHRNLARASDPDRHKYTSSTKTTRFETLLYLMGFSSLGPLLRNVFGIGAETPSNESKGETSKKKKESFNLRDICLLLLWQGGMITGLSYFIGWWAYPALWLLPVYVFSYCGDLARQWLEHCHPEPDDIADQHRLITYSSNPLERMFYAPMNMNLHIAHHLWTSIPYYNLPKADRLIQERNTAPELIWRKSYVGTMLSYFRALPLPECRLDKQARSLPHGKST